MTDRQLIRKYLKERYPVGTDIYDSVRNGGPYTINKRSVFEIFPWKAEDYNPTFLPDNPDHYDIEILVRNPGSDVNYKIATIDISLVRFYFNRSKSRQAGFIKT